MSRRARSGKSPAAQALDLVVFLVSSPALFYEWMASIVTEDSRRDRAMMAFGGLSNALILGAVGLSFHGVEGGAMVEAATVGAVVIIAFTAVVGNSTAVKVLVRHYEELYLDKRPLFYTLVSGVALVTASIVFLSAVYFQTVALGVSVVGFLWPVARWAYFFGFPIAAEGGLILFFVARISERGMRDWQAELEEQTGRANEIAEAASQVGSVRERILMWMQTACPPGGGLHVTRAEILAAIQGATESTVGVNISRLVKSGDIFAVRSAGVGGNIYALTSDDLGVDDEIAG